jgi:hypothetical protein
MSYHTSFLTSGAQAIYNSILKNLHFDDFPAFVAYIPTGDRTGWTDGIPQTFVAVMPEPSTLLLIGSGLLVTARKFRS